MVLNQGLPETNPGAAQEGSESQRSRRSPPHQEVSARNPVSEDTAEEGVCAGSSVPEETEEKEVSARSPVPEDTTEEEVPAPAGPRDPSQQPSTATSVTSHSSICGVEPVAFNRLCPQPSSEPPSAGVKRKRSAHVREAAGEGEEKSLYYMKVQAVNGVSVAWKTGTGFEAISKRPRIFKAKYSGGESFAGSDLSSSHTKAELGDVDQETESGAGGPAEEAPQQPTGEPPEWLLTIEQGVRCLACCRVFPSMEVLTQHVKQGLHEGFSCRVYYRVLGQMRARQRSQRRRVLGPWESRRSRKSRPHQGVSARRPVPEDTVEEGVSAGTHVPEDTVEEKVSARSPVPEERAEEGVSGGSRVPEDTVEKGVSAGSPVSKNTAEEGVPAGSPVPEDTAEEGVSAGSPVPKNTVEKGVSAGSPVPQDTAEEGVSAWSPVPKNTAEEGVSAGSPVPEDTAEEGVPARSPVAEVTVEEGVSAPAGPRDPRQHPSAATSISSYSATHGVELVASNHPCAQLPCEPPSAGMKRKSSAHVREAEGEGEEKTLFYMKVQAVNSVSVAWETGTGFEAISKRPRIFKAKYSGGESFAGSDLSSSHTKAELGDVDQEAESGAGGPAEEAPQQPTGEPPEWLLTIEQGVRCLACCRVFPSLEALTQHVKQGLHEGFSCRVYYRVLGQMRARERSQRRGQRGGRGWQPRVRECSKCGGQIRRPHKATK